MNSKAEMQTKEIVELLIAIAVVALLVLLLYSLISPEYDEKRETAKSYFETLEGEIEKAAGGGVGQFEMWQPGDDTFVIYFGDYRSYEVEGKTFFSKKTGDNKICVCYWDDGESVCGFCKSLNSKVVYDGAISDYRANENGQWGTVFGWEYEIKKQDGEFVFTEVGAPEGWKKEEKEQENKE